MTSAAPNERPELGALFDQAGEPALRRPLRGITADSRQVLPGGLFLAIAGRRSHGLDYVDEALTRGACAVAWEPAAGRPAPVLPDSIVSLRVPDLHRRLGELADRYFGRPSAELSVVGITGTNGKTTCAWLLAAALERLGQGCGYLGTLGAGRPGAVEPGELTTADAVRTHERLARLREQGARWAAMEVSSHALDQDRVAGVRFRGAVFTNLSRDHLDYHGDMQRYAEAKARLFRSPGLRACVVNAEDAYGRELLAGLHGAETVAIGRSARARYRLEAMRRWARPGGLAFELDGSWGRAAIESPLIGVFNLTNLLCVLAVLLVSGFPLAEAAEAVSGLSAAPGRMEAFGGRDRPLVLVDYAHTPAALEQALTAAREHCGGRLIVVFGCGGDRDRGKRPLMGEVAARLADRVYLTNDNPRSEEPQAIAAAIRAGMPADADVRTVLDRRVAIRAAVAEARAGDLVLVAGKGHETCQIFGGQRRKFDDRIEVRAALEDGP